MLTENSSDATSLSIKRNNAISLPKEKNNI